MIKTKIKKALAVASIATITMATLGTSAFAAQIGTGTVVGDATFDSPINWDGTYGVAGNASGSVANILVKATVESTLNMEISTATLDLGTLIAGAESTASLDIEIGTNAADGVSITARSQSAGLTNTIDATTQINDLVADGIAESYKFASALNAASDSSVAGFTQSAALDSEIDDNTTEHLIYTSDKAQATNGVNDLTFTVKATADAQTPAGSYEDHVTFTVTGNF